MAFRENMNMKVDELARGKTVLDSGPVDIEMTPYYDCNVTCRMCDWRSRQGSWSPRIYSELAKTLSHVEHLYFTGGEPLLHFEDVFMKRVMQHPFLAMNNDLRISIVTNGILIDKSFIDTYLIQLPLKCVNVSVHAVTPETYYQIIPDGNWEKVQKALDLLLNLQKKKTFEVMANFVVQKENYQEMGSFVSNCEQRGILVRLIRGSGKGQITDLQRIYRSLIHEIEEACMAARKPQSRIELRRIRNFYEKSFGP